MFHRSHRPTLSYGSALGGAMLWGAMELVALQWSWLMGRARQGWR